MENDTQARSGVWWRGAASAALKGIPQGIMLGAIASVLLFGGIWAVGALGFTATATMLATSFGSFLYTGAPAFAGIFNPVPIIIFNTVLTSIGNFLTGGAIAVNKYQQEMDHERNEVRISQIEAREQALEKMVGKPSATIQALVDKGPRNQQSFAEAATASKEAKGTPVIH
jgi:hypothetical protein